MIAVMLLVVAGFVAFVPWVEKSWKMQYAFPAGCVALAILLIYRSLSSVAPLTLDLREGKVLSFEGALDKSRASDDDVDNHRTTYLVDIGDKSFTIDRAMYRSLFSGAYLRVYYLPRSSRVVNYEQLGHAANVAGPSLLSLFATLGTGVISRNSSVENDILDIARPAIGSVGEYEYQHPAEPADETAAVAEMSPLARVILGSWTHPIMTVTFNSDGILDVVTAGGFKRWGHWSVDDLGRLRSDILGKDGVVDIEVTGDRLTISLSKPSELSDPSKQDKLGLTFKRVA